MARKAQSATTTKIGQFIEDRFCVSENTVRNPDGETIFANRVPGESLLFSL